MVAAAAASAADLPPPGFYASAQAAVTVSGEPCGIGVPLAPPFLLRIGPIAHPGAEDAVGVLVDDAGVAMPIVPRTDGRFDVVDGSEPRHSGERALGTIVAAAAPLTLDVDFRRYELGCSVRGSITFAPSADAALLERADQLTRAWLAIGERDAKRNAGDARAAFAPAREAEALLRAALGAEHRLALINRGSIASLHWDRDELAAARAIGEEVVAGLTRTLGPDHVEVLQATSNLALVLWDQGELAEAEARLRHVADRHTLVLDPDDGKRLGTLTNLATLLGQRGRYVEAETLLRDVVLRRERTAGPAHPATMIAINNLANTYSLAGWTDEAIVQHRAAYERYRASLGPRHPATARSRHNLATLVARQGDLATAIAEYREVLAIRREVLGERHDETLISHGSLASVLAESGALDEALAAQREVVVIREAVSGAEHQQTLQAQAVLGRIESMAGRHADAVARLRAAHATAAATLGADDRQTVEIAAQLGYAQRRAGNAAGARATLAGVVGAVERWREAGVFTASRRATLFAPWARAYKELAFATVAQGDAAAGFDQAEQSKARVLVESLALRRGETPAILPRAALDALATLDARVAALEAEQAAATDASQRIALAQSIASASANAAKLRAELRERHPKYAELSQARLLAARDGAAELARGSVFVSYLVHDDRVLAFTVERGGRLRGHDLWRIDGLRELVAAYRALLSAQPGALPVWRTPEGRFVSALAAPPGATRVHDADVPGALLYARLVAPLPALARARRWVVSPDGPLALVPFEALPQRGKPLVMTRAIRYAPSLTVFALTARRDREYRRIVGRAPLYAMGAALYDTAQPRASAPAATPRIDGARLAHALGDDPLAVRRAYDRLGARWVELPGSLAEITAVAAGFRAVGPVIVRARADATEARLRADDRDGTLARHRYVLLSAHGHLSTEAPGLSAIVLGQQDVTPEADGYVTAAEWAGFTLRSDLIVASACETGVGRIVEGEGVAGLPYALFVAGNRNVLLTLWPVADASSAALVVRFFALVRAGHTQADALATAKREFASGGRYRAPVHWAPFVLWGS